MNMPGKARALNVHCDKDNMWVALEDGRQLDVPLVYFPRLLNATPAQHGNYILSGGGTGIHWEELDEDISVEGLLLGIGDRTRSPDNHDHHESLGGGGV